MGKNGDGVGGLSQRDFLVGTGAGVCAGLGYSVDFDGNCELLA